jgi:hypothetical protein
MSGGAGGSVFAADPGQVNRGAKHLGAISDLVADIFNELRRITVLANGNGPIAKAIRENYEPSAADSLKFLGELAKLLTFHGAQTANLSRLLDSVGISATDLASSAGGRRH